MMNQPCLGSTYMPITQAYKMYVYVVEAGIYFIYQGRI